jgi:COMPASS component SWD3
MMMMNITTKPTLTLIKELPAEIGPINTVAISPNRHWIATAGGSSLPWQADGNFQWSLQVYDRAWDKIDLARQNASKPHGVAINSICFSSENKLIVGSSSDHDKPSISHWNIDRKRAEFAIEPNENIFAIITSADGQKFFTAKGWGLIKEYSTNFGKILHDRSKSNPNIRNNPIYALAISSDSKYLYTGGEDRKIVVWHTQSGAEVRLNSQYHDKAVRSLCLSNDDRILASGSDQRIRIWNAKTGEILNSFYAHADWVRGLAITPDLRLLISAGDEKIKIWDLATGNKLNTIIAHDRPIRSIALSQDGNILVSGATDGIVKVWQINDLSEIEGL